VANFLSIERRLTWPRFCLLSAVGSRNGNSDGYPQVSDGIPRVGSTITTVIYHSSVAF